MQGWRKVDCSASFPAQAIWDASFCLASHASIMSAKSSCAHHKSIALLILRGVRNKEVSPEASTDGLTASWITSNDPHLQLARPLLCYVRKDR